MNWEIILLVGVVLAVGAFLWLEIRSLKSSISYKLNSTLSSISDLLRNKYEPPIIRPSFVPISNPSISLSTERKTPSPKYEPIIEQSEENVSETTSALEKEIEKYKEELMKLEENDTEIPQEENEWNNKNDLWENVEGHSIHSDELKKISESETSMKGVPSEALSNGKKENTREDIIDEHNDLDTPGLHGDEMVENLLNSLVHETNSIVTNITDISEGRIDLYKRVMKENNLDSLKNLCRLYNIPVKGNKKELSKKLLENEKFIKDHNKVYPDNTLILE